MCYTVYVHITPNNKYYVGITKQNVQNRWKNSLGYQSQRLFWRAIKKYGWDNIKHIIIATGLTHDDACKKEIELIAKYQSNNPKYGYNRTSGGDGTCNFSHKNPHSDDWKRKVSIANTGKKRTPEQCKNIGNAMRGKHHTEQTKQQISKTCKEINTAQYFNKPEVREKMLQKKRIGVELYDESGNTTIQFKSMTDCAKYLGVSVALINKVLNGKCIKNKYNIRRSNNE